MTPTEVQPDQTALIGLAELLRPLVTPIIHEAVAAAVRELGAAGGKRKLAVNEEEAAAMLGVEGHRLRDMRLAGRVSGRRIGRRVVYSIREIERFLAEGPCEDSAAKRPRRRRGTTSTRANRGSKNGVYEVGR